MFLFALLNKRHMKAIGWISAAIICVSVFGIKMQNKAAVHNIVAQVDNSNISKTDAINIMAGSATLVGTVENKAASVPLRYKYGFFYADESFDEANFEQYVSQNKKNLNIKYASYLSNNTFAVKIENLKSNTVVKYCAVMSVGDSVYSHTPFKTFKTTELQISTDKKVDLGLSVDWAGYNIGASAPSEYGNYFGWGDITGSVKSTRYKDYVVETSDDDKNVVPDYDIATSLWGEEWRMPTLTEVKELLDKCTWTWVEYKKTNGYAITGPNGNTIFLPAAGCRYGNTICVTGERGSYWTGDLCNSYNAYYLYFNNNYHGYNYFLCYGGRSVRAVAKK